MAKTNSDYEVQHGGMLLINDEGHSLHFVINVKDSEEQEKLKNTISNHLGFVSTELDEAGPHSMVLVDNASLWSHNRIEKFKIGYIYDCLKQRKILDISEYLWARSNIYRINFDYMDVVYFRKHSWDNVPEKYLFCQNESDSDSSSFENVPLPTPQVSYKKDDRKHTKQPYNKTEKEAIINHIVQRNLYNHIKGVAIWKEMETIGICPRRTWQSMKEHTIKSIAKELNIFKSITPKQRQKLDEALNPKRR